jgi:hypothetical protein
VRGNYTLDVVVKENTHFFEYCRQQKIVPDEEFSAFETALKVSLIFAQLNFLFRLNCLLLFEFNAL